MRKVEKNIVILISGSGSNMAAIAQAAQKDRWRDRFGAGIACVVSNRGDSPGLAAAQALGVPSRVIDHQQYATRAAFDAALQAAIDDYQPALVVLAGFMRILTPLFVAHYAGRLVNIHPSLLPAFAGLNTHQRALDAGCKFTGATVHLVSADLDHGQVLAQVVVPVLPQDTAADLAQRVLSQEHQLYPKVLGQLLQALTNTAGQI